MTLNKTFWLNGQKYSTTKIVSLSDLIAYFNYPNKLLVLEYNNSICNRAVWEKVLISDLAKIEIVTIVGGG